MGLWPYCFSRRQTGITRALQNWLRKLVFHPRFTEKAGELSHGQKQWLEIGMLLAQEPRLLLVDEPAAGMTPAEREHTTDLLKEAAKSPRRCGRGT